MVRKHVYLQLIELEDIDVITKDDSFSKIEGKNTKTELGTVYTPNTTYHILFGQFPREGCHWCGSDVEVKVLDPSFSINDPVHYFKVFMECPKCSSRGPAISVNTDVFKNKQSEDHVRHLVADRYKQINAFRGFKNPYKENIDGK